MHFMRNRHLFRTCFAATMAALLLSPLIVPQTQASLKDPEALYFDELPGFKPIELTVEKITAVYANRNRNGHLKNFVKGEKVRLIAYDEKTFLVENLKTDYSGWVPAENLSKIDPAVISSAMAQAEEQKKYQAAIEDHQVLAGMTLEQVQASLGKPDEAAFRTDSNGRTDVWSYIEYKTIYREQTYTDQSTGQLIVRRLKEKIPESEKNVEFLNGRVTAIEKKQLR